MKNNLKNALIVGAGIAGKELSGELKRHLHKTYKIIGFIDDDIKKTGKTVNGLKVLGDTTQLDSLILKHKIDEVFIALPSGQGDTIRRIIESCSRQKVLFKIVPRTLEIILGKVKLPSVREVRIEDLLGRSIIRSDQKKFLKFFKNKKILVTGAAGSIGSELCRQLIQFNPKKLICFDIWESGLFELDMQLKNLGYFNFEIIVGNIQDKKKLETVFINFKPEIVFHAAAFKHVPIMQLHPDEAVKNNVFGTKNLAEVSLKSGVKKFINISTDKAADPSSVMGTTKLLAEKIVQDANLKNSTQFISVRFGNVLDSQGSVVPVFKKQIALGGPITVTDPQMSRFFMTIPEAVQLVLDASILGKGGEIFVLDMGTPVKIDEMARILIRLSGFLPDKDIKIKYTGIRPGEKLSEVLYSEKEELEKTENEKVFRIRQTHKPDGKLSAVLKGLEKLIYTKNKKEIISFLRRVAPNLQLK